MSGILVVKPKEIVVPFESSRQKEVLFHSNKMTLDGLYDKASQIQSRCEDTVITTTNYDTVHYDVNKDVLSCVTEDGVFHSLMTRHSMSQLCNRLGVSVRYLDKLRERGLTDLISENVNTLLTAENHKLLARMYKVGDKRFLRGLLTPSYSPLDTDDILGTFIECVSDSPISDYKVKDFTLTPERFHARLTGPKLKVPGEDLYAGIQLDSSDVGKSRLNIKFLIYKLVCTNGLMVAKLDSTLFEQVHKGIDAGEFKSRFVASIERLPELAASATTLIKHVVKDGERYDFNNMSAEDMESFMKSVKRKTELSDKSVDKVITLMNTNYQPTRWGLVNAITEVAQDYTLDKRLELERIAGDILVA